MIICRLFFKIFLSPYYSMAKILSLYDFQYRALLYASIDSAGTNISGMLVQLWNR